MFLLSLLFHSSLLQKKKSPFWNETLLTPLVFDGTYSLRTLVILKASTMQFSTLLIVSYGIFIVHVMFSKKFFDWINIWIFPTSCKVSKIGTVPDLPSASLRTALWRFDDWLAIRFLLQVCLPVVFPSTCDYIKEPLSPWPNVPIGYRQS